MLLKEIDVIEIGIIIIQYNDGIGLGGLVLVLTTNM